MSFPADPVDDLHRHLSGAVLLLAECSPAAVGIRQEHLINIGWHLTTARYLLSRPTAGEVVVGSAAADAESDDERIERKAAEAAERARRVLASLDLSPAEGRFATDVGHRLVDLATDAYRDTLRQGQGFDGCCVSAAVAVALAIVYDPDACGRND